MGIQSCSTRNRYTGMAVNAASYEPFEMVVAILLPGRRLLDGAHMAVRQKGGRNKTAMNEEAA